MQNIAHEYKAITLLEPQVVTTDITGATGVNVEKYNDDAMVVLSVGETSGAASTCDVTVEASTNGGSTYSTVLTFGQMDWGSGGTMAGKLNIENVTHLRVDVDVDGATPSYALSVVLLALSERQGTTLNSLIPDDES
jgi:hypothetical protein